MSKIFNIQVGVFHLLNLIQFITLSTLLLSSCTALKTYSDIDSPVWFSNELAEIQDSSKKDFSVMTFNIEKSEKIALAIDEIKNDSDFTNAEIFLLQEVDEQSVIRMAKTFRLNYVYYPIAINRKEKNNFGNAILSKYLISKPSKLILPHCTPTQRIRNATNCIIKIGSKRVLVYSIHNETIIMSQSKRMNQVEAILNDLISKNVHHVIVGGDFNSGIPRDLKEIVHKFRRANLEWATKEIGGTSKAIFNLVHPRNDHIFTKGCKPITSKKLENSKSSDHLPVLVRFSLESDTDKG